MKAYRIKVKETNKVKYLRFQKDVAKQIGITAGAIRKQFRKKGHYENKDYVIERIEVL